MMTLWPQYPQSQIHKCPSFRGRKYCTFSFLISATYLPLTSVALQKVKGTCFASLILFRQVETCSATHAPMKCLRLPQHARLKMLYVFMKIDIYFVHLWLYCRAVICGFCVFLYCTCTVASKRQGAVKHTVLAKNSTSMRYRTSWCRSGAARTMGGTCQSCHSPFLAPGRCVLL